MQALWDQHPELPYRAVVPWPEIERNGNLDWIASVGTLQERSCRNIDKNI